MNWIFGILIGAILSVGYFLANEVEFTKREIDLTRLNGAVIVGKVNEWGDFTSNNERLAFKRNDTIWTELYMIPVFDSYRVGDTIKVKSIKNK